jgi:bifunctional aspartokinase / homoserine dehydrogenase 1
MKSGCLQQSSGKAFAITSAMGSHPSSPVKVTDLILNMIAKAAEKDDGFLLDLAALQEKHIVTAKELLGDKSPAAKEELTSFTAQLLNDISNLKSMLQAISIGVHFVLHHCEFQELA